MAEQVPVRRASRASLASRQSYVHASNACATHTKPMPPKKSLALQAGPWYRMVPSAISMRSSKRRKTSGGGFRAGQGQRHCQELAEGVKLPSGLPQEALVRLWAQPEGWLMQQAQHDACLCVLSRREWTGCAARQRTCAAETHRMQRPTTWSRPLHDAAHAADAPRPAGSAAPARTCSSATTVVVCKPLVIADRNWMTEYSVALSRPVEISSSMSTR